MATLPLVNSQKQRVRHIYCLPKPPHLHDLLLFLYPRGIESELNQASGMGKHKRDFNMKNRQIFAVAFISTLVSSLFLPASNASNTLDQKPAALPPVVVVTGTTSGAAFGGGGGGSFETACPANYVATGISASNYVAATNWYNTGLAVTCALVVVSPTGSLSLTTTTSKKAAFVFSSFTANRDSLCSSGNALTEIRVHANGTGFVQDVGANCKSFPSQALSESVSSANSPTWDGVNPSLSSCPAGSFVIGIYGRNGEGIDRLGARCGAFSVDYPKVAPFESAFPMDLIPTSASSLSVISDFATCSVGSFGYQFVGMSAKDAQKVELDSVTLILKSNGVIVGSASSDSYKNLPRWLLGIDSGVQDAPYSKGSATWKLSSISSSAEMTCQILAYKEHQMTYLTIK